MMKRKTVSGLLALLCCVVLLTPCVGGAVAADALPWSDGFESYADNAALNAVWTKDGGADNSPAISTEQKCSGDKSMLLDDTQTSQALQAYVKIPNNTAKGTEFILSAKYYAESVGGSGSYKNPYIRLVNTSTDTYTYSTGEWDRLSTLYTTTKANESLTIRFVSNAATVSKVYWDDVSVSVLTEQLALDYIDEKLNVPGFTGLSQILTSKTLKLTDVDTDVTVMGEYAAALAAKRTSKGSALTKAEVQACITEVNTANETLVQEIAATVAKNQTLSTLGDIALPSVSDSTVTLKWTAVTGDTNSRILMQDGGPVLESQPAYGSAAETVTMTLTISKGTVSATVVVATKISAYTQGMSKLIQAADQMDITSYLNGEDSVDFVTTDLKSLPSNITVNSNTVYVSWEALNASSLSGTGMMNDAGAVTRNGYGTADTAVRLRATLRTSRWSWLSSETYYRDFYLVVPSFGAEETREMIARNADFESTNPAGENEAVDGWLKHTKWADAATGKETTYAVVDTARVFSGSQSLRITVDKTMAEAAAANSARAANVQNAHVFTAREGYVYNLQALAYTRSQTANPSVTMKFLDNEGVVLAARTMNYYTSSNSVCGTWKNLSVSGTAPAGTVMVTAQLNGGTAEGVTWFDNVRLREWPLVANGSFDLGTVGWDTTGTASGGSLTLPSGVTATSAARDASRGVTYFLSVEAQGNGTAALQFLNSSKEVLGTCSVRTQTGALYACAPANTAWMRVVLTGGTGGLTVQDVKITRAASGTGVADGGFEYSAAGAGTPWDLTSATISNGTGKCLTISGSGSALSNVIPIIDGKSYTFTADVKGDNGTMTIEMYTAKGKNESVGPFTVKSNGADWNTISCTIDPIPGSTVSGAIEHTYAQIKLSGSGAVFDNAAVYSVTDSVSNPSMENLNNAQYGSFPYNWSTYGLAAGFVANQEGQATEGIKSLGVELFGLGEGGVRSSMVKAEGGKAYEASVHAKGSGVSLNIEFWDESFTKLPGSGQKAINADVWTEYSVTGTAPEGTAYVSLSVGGSGTGLAYVDEVSIVPVVRTIGTNVQLFLDDWLVKEENGVERTFHPGTKLGKQMINKGWYGNVVWNPDKQLYEMWYQSSDKDVSYSLWYCTSQDGETWGKATQCISKDGAGTEYKSLASPTVFRDENEMDAGKRYKLICYNYGGGGYDLHTSADGINWTRYGNVLPGGDVITVAYDEANREYVATYKMSMAIDIANKRTHSIAVSKDLIHWTEGVRMYNVATPLDTQGGYLRADGYGTSMYPLGDSYIGFNWRFQLNENDGYSGKMDVPLLFSRDLTEDWQRMYDAEGNLVMAIPRGAEGSWDDAQTYAHSYPIQMGGETWWYYHGWTGDHSHNKVGVPKTPAISAVKWRRNGFASLDFAAEGTMTTEQFTLAGNQVRLNAVGPLTVELLDASGKAVASAQFTGDSVDEALVWNNSVDEYLGQTVSLKFTAGADTAQLYSVQLRLQEKLTPSYFIDMQSSLELIALLDLPSGEDYTYTVTHGTQVTEHKAFQVDTLTDTLSYKMSYDGIAAKEMRDTIAFTVYKGAAVVDTVETSIYDIAKGWYEAEKAKETPERDYLNLMADMLNYGAQAQKAFKYDYDAEDARLQPMAGSDAVGVWRPTPNVGASDTLKNMVAATLSLKDRIELNVYVGDVNAQLTYVTFNGVVVSDPNQYRFKDDRNPNLACFKFDDLAVKDVKGVFELGITLKDGTEGTVRYSIADYVLGALQDANQKDLIVALQKYVDSAEDYLSKYLNRVWLDENELRVVQVTAR